MNHHHSLEEIVQKLRKTLPAQAPLKDFIATNTLYTYQRLPFLRGLQEAQEELGVKPFLSRTEYQDLVTRGKISQKVLDWVMSQEKNTRPPEPRSPGSIRLRDIWKTDYKIDLITHVHPLLFRHLSHFLDQGVSFLPVPFLELGFWGSLQELERKSYFSLFKGKKRGRSSRLLQKTASEALQSALTLLVGDDELFEKYLFEMTHEHPGWSGMVSVLEEHPQHLNFARKISLTEVLAFELLLELDYIDFFTQRRGKQWKPIGIDHKSTNTWSSHQKSPSRSEGPSLEHFHEAWEWTFYQQLLTGLKENFALSHEFQQIPSSQVFFCIDDRCCSLRQHLEEVNPSIETFGTPGFFSVEFLYKSETERFPVKLCPAPLQPQFLVEGSHEKGFKKQNNSDFLLSRLSHTLFGGWLISQTFGLLSAFRLVMNIFSPALSSKVAASFYHTDDRIRLKFRREIEPKTEKDLKLGFSKSEMAERVFGLLVSCGLKHNFSKMVVMLGHGSSTVNNPHYAAYDCGACSGRPGSINARIFCSMANDLEVRRLVQEKGISIPETTVFVPALFDTTRDEIFFYDCSTLTSTQLKDLELLKKDLEKALLRNAKERSRRFDDISLNAPPELARTRLQRKSISIFEPRQEFTHAGNAACIVGPRKLTRGLFLDRRSFLNSYDPSLDPSGDILCNILKAAVPVCGGINLQYFFSRVDNEKMGSGTKLPHNVVGLFAVANGTEGDLRPGLPLQMVEWHEPLRLMIVVYHEAAIALKAAQKIPATFEWIQNEWVKYVSVSPSSHEFFVFDQNEMKPFDFFGGPTPTINDSLELVSQSRDYLPISLVRGNR